MVRPSWSSLLALNLLLAGGPQTAATPETASRPADRYDALILRYSQAARLNPRMLKALIQVESDFDPRAVSRMGARGLMQLMPTTAEGAGVPRSRLFEPETNLRAGTAFLSYLHRAGSVRNGLPPTTWERTPAWLQRRILAAYHAGPRMLTRDRWPRSTHAYVNRVMRLSRSRGSRLRLASDPGQQQQRA